MTPRPTTAGLAPGWTAWRFGPFGAAVVVDPAGPTPDLPRALPAHSPARLSLAAGERNRVALVRGDIGLRDGAGVLRLVIGSAHQSIHVIGTLWPETTCSAVVNKPLGRVVALPFGYPPGVFVRSAWSHEPENSAPRVRLDLSRPLWWFGPVPFPCGEDRA